MMPWNRKEVFVTHSLQKLAEVRGILAQNGIEYDDISPYNPFSGSGRGHTGSIATGDPDRITTYRVFVHKEDYDTAVSVLRQINTNR
ncbi:hypothetical protein LJC56_03720 [Christensenellaceae bacterium OttesenSCG-928-K19]|nr:hypothetical protein [Christensenellaceae bacterium OttesenSCG-928-K19]